MSELLRQHHTREQAYQFTSVGTLVHQPSRSLASCHQTMPSTVRQHLNCRCTHPVRIGIGSITDNAKLSCRQRLCQSGFTARKNHISWNPAKKFIALATSFSPSPNNRWRRVGDGGGSGRRPCHKPVPVLGLDGGTLSISWKGVRPSFCLRFIPTGEARPGDRFVHHPDVSVAVKQSTRWRM